MVEGRVFSVLSGHFFWGGEFPKSRKIHPRLSAFTVSQSSWSGLKSSFSLNKYNMFLELVSFAYYPRDFMLARVFARATCLSVRHAPVLCLHHHPTILFFWCQISSRHSKGFPRAGASNKGEVGKISSFLSLSLNISKTLADTAKLQLTTNRKSHMGFPLTPRSWMTLICYRVKLYRNFAWFCDFGRQQND